MDWETIMPLSIGALFYIGAFIYFAVGKYDDYPTKRALGVTFLISAIFIPLFYLFFRSICFLNVFKGFDIEDEMEIMAKLPKYKKSNKLLYGYRFMDSLMLRWDWFAKLFARILDWNVFLRILVCLVLVIVYEVLLEKVLNLSEGFRAIDEQESEKVREQNKKIKEHNASLERVYERSATITRDAFCGSQYNVTTKTKDVTRYKDEKTEPLPVAVKRILIVFVLFWATPIISSVCFGLEAMIAWLVKKK